MKTRKTILCGILAVVLALAFIACGDSDDSNDPNNPTNPNNPSNPNNPNNPAPDGTVWTPVPDNIADFDISVRELAWGGGKFVVGTESTMNTAFFAYSSDGKSWTPVADPKFAPVLMTDIAWGGGKFVAVGASAKMTYSSDGVIWTVVEDENNAFIDSRYGQKSSIHSVVYGDGKFVAGGISDRIAYSTNGVTWTLASNTTGIFGYSGILRLAYGGGTFVAAALQDKMAVSSDGITWTAVTQSIFSASSSYSSTIGSEIAYGGGKFVVGGYNGAIAYSTNGVTWTAAENNPFYYPYKYEDAEYDMWAWGASNLQAIAYGGGKFVAVNYGGKTAVSTDGATWTLVSDRVFAGDYTPGTLEAITNNAIVEIAHDGGKFIVMSLSGRVAYWDGN